MISRHVRRESAWDRVPQDMRAFDWATPADPVSPVWRGAHPDRAARLIRSLGFPTAGIAGVAVEFHDDGKLWVQFRDNRDRSLLTTQTLALAKALGRAVSPKVVRLMPRTAGPFTHLYLVDDLKGVRLPRHAVPRRSEVERFVSFGTERLADPSRRRRGVRDPSWRAEVDEVAGPGIPLYVPLLVSPDGTTYRYRRPLKDYREAVSIARDYARGLNSPSTSVLLHGSEWSRR